MVAADENRVPYLAPYLPPREETEMPTNPLSSGDPVARDLELLGARPPEETER